MSSSLMSGQLVVHGLADRSSLAEVFQETAARVPDRIALRTPDDSFSITWRQYGERVEAIARGLSARGVTRGSVVAILLRPRPEFNLVDTAILHLGAAAVSIYSSLPAAEIAYLLEDSGARLVITEAALLSVVEEAAALAGSVELISVDGGSPEVPTLNDVESKGDSTFDFESSWRRVEPTDLAVIIYTSGTTGTPKGVELTHRAILGNQEALAIANGVVDGARAISFLPMAHVAERHLSHYRPMVGGFTVTVIADHTQIPSTMVAFHPHYFFSPPRLYEKFHAGLVLAVESGSAELREKFDRMLELGGRELDAREGDGSPLGDDEAAELAELQSTTGKKILGMVGLDSVTAGLTGSAPISKPLLTFYLALGMPLLEAWGLSECGAFGAFNTVEHSRVGTIGRAVHGAEIRLAEDGEILFRSPWMMRGYRNRPEDTHDAIDPDGWLHTGDVGTLSDDGFLTLIDRKKDIIINSFGKNMSPVNIENKLRAADPIIGQAVAIGDGRPHISALLVLEPETLHAFARSLGADGLSVEQLVEHAAVRSRVQAAVDSANSHLSRVEHVRSWLVLPTEWTPASDELTPTMKLRRRQILRKYADEISTLT